MRPHSNAANTRMCSQFRYIGTGRQGKKMSHKYALIRCVTELMLLLAIAGSAHAQITYKIPTGFGWRQGLPLDLLEVEAVQKDLGLSAETSYKLSLWRASVAEAAKSEAASVKDEIRPGKILRSEILQKVQLTFQSELDLLLTAEQQNRLHEIDFQLEGCEALSDPRVAEALELTSEQQSKISSIHKRMLREEIDSEKGAPKADHLTFEARDQLLLDVLKPAQQDNFSRMKGSAFDRSGFLQSLRLRDRELEVWNVKYSPDGKILASSRQNDIFIWDAESGNAISCMRGHAANITSMCFGPDGKWIISASTDRTVRSWDVESGNNILSHGEKHSAFNGWFIRSEGSRGSRWSCFRNIALSPNGRDLARVNGTSVSTWIGINPLVPPFFRGRERILADQDRQPVWSVAYSPDGKLQAYGRIDGGVYIFGFGKPRKIIAATDAVLCVVFSPDGKQLATASIDGSVKLWEISSGQELFSAKTHQKAARSVAFSPDGALLASASDDGTVKLWRLDGSTEPVMVMRHMEQATSVAFSPDGKRLASAGSDNVVRVWDPMNGHEMLTLSR